MQVLGGDERKPVFGQSTGGVIGSRNLFHEVVFEEIPVTAFDHFLFLAEIIQDI